MMRSHFLSVISSGFSTMTCSPAFAAATAGSAWAPLGVAMVTASTALSASIASSDSYGVQPKSFESASARPGALSQQATSLAPRTSARALAWKRLIMPAPTIPKPMGIGGSRFWVQERDLGVEGQDREGEAPAEPCNGYQARPRQE